MKKNRLMKVTSILAAAIMTASAAMTVSADYMEATEVEAYTEASMALQSAEAAAGGTVEIPLALYSNNQCTFYDLVLEYDSKLEFAEAEGAKAVEYEDDGKKFISLVRFETSPFQDGESAAVIRFNVPEDAAVGDTFKVDFAQITNFSSLFEEFEDYTLSGAVVTVNKEFDPGVKAMMEEEKASPRMISADDKKLTLEGREAVPGELVQVPLVMYTNNECTSYDILVEYDSRLEFKHALGVKAVNGFEEAGRKFVAIAGYENSPFKDGKTAATIALYVPEDAQTDDYEIKFSEISSVESEDGELYDYTTSDAVISVVNDSDSEDGLGNAKVYKKNDSRGNLFETFVGVRGDVNGDGKANIKDAVAIAKICASRKQNSVDEKSRFFGDVNDDGSLDIKDAVKIAKYVAKGKVTWNF